MTDRLEDLVSELDELDIPLVYGDSAYQRKRYATQARNAHAINGIRQADGSLAWDQILLGSVFALLAEESTSEATERALEVAVVAASIVEALDRQKGSDEPIYCPVYDASCFQECGSSCDLQDPSQYVEVGPPDSEVD